MNDCKDSSVKLFWWLERNVLLPKISKGSHEKWMILNRVLLNYFDDLNEMSYYWRLVKDHMRNEWF